jgi:hypothetical protein
MFFWGIEIITSFTPTKCYDLKKAQILLFPSKNKVEKGLYYSPSTLCYIVFYGRKSELTKDKIKNKMKIFIRFLNFLLQDHYSIKWLKENGPRLNIKPDDLYPYTEISEFIDSHIEKDQSNIKELYNINFYNFNLNEINKFSLIFELSFEDSYLKFLSLKEDDELRNQIELYSLINNITVLLTPFYENDNLEKSLMFIIAESIINEIIEDNQITKKCDFCDKDIPASKGMNRKISEFTDGFNIGDYEKKLVKKTLRSIAKLRHKFFHANKSMTAVKAIETMLEKIGNNTTTIEEELKYGDGRFLGFFIMKMLFQLLLYKKLMNIE